MKRGNLIIGITGTIRSGKGTLVNALTNKGFHHFSFRKYLEDLGARNRDEMVELANRLRKEHGPSYIAEQLFAQAQKISIEPGFKGASIIESLRTPGEIKALREKGEFYLIAVDAPLKERYDRAVKEGSSTDNITFEEFKEHDQREMASDDPTKQNISDCMQEADYLFWNDYETKEKAETEFTSGKYGFLNLFGNNKRRPTFDEVFMRQAVEWSSRSTCLSRHTGAVIVDEDNTLISQGYNGAPRGVMHCEDRGGCERRKRNIPSGERLELCFAVHAEANAILNSKQPVVGATMYATNHPCNDCSKVIIQKGIKKVIYLGNYVSELGEIMLEEAGVEMQRYRQGVHPKAFPRIWD